MRTTFTLRASLALAVLLAIPGQTAVSQVPTDLASWQPMPGDEFVVSVEVNVGMIVRRDRSASVSFPVATGQRRSVRYIGRTYYAGTPLKQWIVRSADVKSDLRTFGPTGLFLRLYKNDDVRSPYGIHGTVWTEEWFASGDRFRSMGCIVVSEDVLALLHRTYLLNGEELRVATVARFSL